MTTAAICTHPAGFSSSSFTGKERDTESGNDYFGARYYASSMGRFMSPDWSAQQEPVPYGKLDDPQTLNLYAYVRNNPLTGIDADGHQEPIPLPAPVIPLPPAYQLPQLPPQYQLTPQALEQAWNDLVDGTSKFIENLGNSSMTPEGYPKDVSGLMNSSNASSSDGQNTSPAPSGQSTPADPNNGMKPGSEGGPGFGKKTTPAQRQETLKENGGKCVVPGCNQPAEHVDHAIPRSRNGDTTSQNLQGMCAHHNCQKGAMTSAEYAEWLKNH